MIGAKLHFLRYKPKISTTTGFYMKLNLRTDQDIIIWLRKQRNRQGAIKQLIRQQLKNKP